MNAPKKVLPGGLFPNDKRAFVDSTLAANKNLDWVKRLREKNTPTITLPGEDKPSTHLMGDNGAGYVFPTLIREPGAKALTNLGREAEDYARETGTGIQFKNKAQGDWFASHKNKPGSYGGYKQGTGVLQQFMKGTKKVKLPKAANGLQRIQTDAATTRGLLAGGLTAGANAIVPGLGNAVGGLEALSSTLKDSNGLYKSKGAQVLDTLNPVTQLTRVGTGIGNLFKGKALDIDGQQAIKDALAKKKMQDMQAATWDKTTADVSSMSQMGQYKAGAKQVNHKAIEIEGGEPHFSKKMNGKRTLKQYHPNGPSHEQGGIPVLAEEGDAIVTAKNNKGAEAVAAHAAGNHKKVEKIISKMPADKGKKKAPDGIRGMRTRKTVPVKQVMPTFTMSPVQDDSVFGIQPPSNTYADRMAAIGQPLRTDTVGPGKMPAAATGKSDLLPRLQGAASDLLQGAPTAYNLAQGLFGGVDRTTRRSYTPALNTYEDLSGPTRQASTQAMRGSLAAARSNSGGNAGNARANASQAYAEDVSRQGNINAQEAGRKLSVNQSNVQAINQAKLQNNYMNDRADEQDMQNAAKKSEALAKGLEGISALSSQKQLLGNTLAKEAADRDMLGQLYKNYEVGPDGKVKLRGLPVQRKGNKAIKVKK